MRYLLVKTANTYEHKIKHRGGHRRPTCEVLVPLYTAVEALLLSIVCTVAPRKKMKSRGGVHVEIGALPLRSIQ